MNTLRPTGTLNKRTVTFTREFNTSREVVWAAMTEPERLQRWIGTWSGDPTSGSVTFCITADGEDACDEPITILDYTPPESLHIHWQVDKSLWDITLQLTEVHNVTTLNFCQIFTGDQGLEMISTSWEFFLDRLTHVVNNQDPDSVNWEDYPKQLSQFYRKLSEQLPK